MPFEQQSQEVDEEPSDHVAQEKTLAILATQPRFRVGEMLGRITAVTLQGAFAQPVPTSPRTSAAVKVAAATSDPWASAAAAAKAAGMTSAAVGPLLGDGAAPMQLMQPTPSAFFGDPL